MYLNMQYSCTVIEHLIYYCKIFCSTTPKVERRHIEWAKNLIIASFPTVINRLSSSNGTVLNKVLQDLKLFYGTEFLCW